ncbi:MAG: hypothetical protein PHG21_15320 [Azoarcus sp.]|nr:hypothetical protein [Azoarcus sp.]
MADAAPAKSAVLAKTASKEDLSALIFILGCLVWFVCLIVMSGESPAVVLDANNMPNMQIIDSLDIRVVDVEGLPGCVKVSDASPRLIRRVGALARQMP